MAEKKQQPKTFNASLRNIWISPRKVRLVIDKLRGQPVSVALDRLKLISRRSSPILAKLIHSAIANAQDRATVDIDRLYIKEAYVGGGTIAYRYIPRAQGRATPVRKRSSHITIKLSEL